MSQMYNGSEVWVVLVEECLWALQYRGKHTQTAISRSKSNDNELTEFYNSNILFYRIKGVLYQSQFAVHLLEHRDLQSVSLADLV